MKLLHKIMVALLPMTLLFAASNGYSETEKIASHQSDIVWHWTDDEHAERFIIFETTVDGKLIATAKFPVSRLARGDVGPDPKQKIFEYNFVLREKKGRAFRGITQGKVEGNIWEAGMEKDGIIFGVSWVTKNTIMMNTLHIAVLDETKVSNQGRGVYFKTYWQNKK
jgi:hypothetical protein